MLGEWYGIIIDAPAGATAAIIGNNVESDTISTPNLNLSSDNKVEIVNNITLTSQSGDAAVRSNTIAGDAISGDATASVNLANIVGSRFSLSGWFGLLFINVFGKWFGNFGVETVPPTPVVENPSSGTVEPVIKFVPKENNVVYYQAASTFASGDSDITTPTLVAQNFSNPELKGVVLAAVDEATPSVDFTLIFIITIVVLMVASTVWLGLQRLRMMRRV